jgi:glycosyltransferase involved in cell wall biosynthesis
MRVGVDARLMYHQPAGISRYTWHLLQAMAELDKDDEFIVFQHRKDRTPLVNQSNFRRATMVAPAHHRLEQTFLTVELLRFNLDLLHSTDFIPPLYSRVKSVITVHDLAFLHYPHFLTTESAAYYGMIDRAVVRADHIIVPSEHTKQDLIGQMGVATDKVSVIYEAANPSFGPLPIEETRRAITAKYGIPQTYVLFVGTIEPRKNVTGLLQAFACVRDKYGLRDDTGLVIAGGKGWLYEETLETVKTLGLEACTFFLGRVADEDLHQLYVGARCHAHLAYYEGFGLPPLEAMACGTPTIVSNVSSLPEVAGDAALLVNPRDTEEIAVAMHRLLTDDDLYAELRQKGLQRAQIFSWEKAARRTLEIYRQVVEARRAPAARTATRTNETHSEV